MNRAAFLGLTLADVSDRVAADGLADHLVERGDEYFRTALRADFRRAVQEVTGQDFVDLTAVSPSRALSWHTVLERRTGPDHGVSVLASEEGGITRFARSQ